MPKPNLVHLVSLAFALAIGVALIEPVPPTLENATHGSAFPFDKLVHFGLFLVAAFPWRRSFAVLGVRSPGFATIATAAVYGGLLEIAQGLWTLRDPEVLDMAAGAVGAMVAMGVVRGLAARRP